VGSSDFCHVARERHAADEIEGALEICPHLSLGALCVVACLERGFLCRALIAQRFGCGSNRLAVTHHDFPLFIFGLARDRVGVPYGDATRFDRVLQFTHPVLNDLVCTLG
jgi:hypothetical protein